MSASTEQKTTWAQAHSKLGIHESDLLRHFDTSGVQCAFASFIYGDYWRCFAKH
jgi:hypothetical protein